MTILRVYKVGDQSWVSPGALLAAIKADDKIKVVKHHPDVKVNLAIGNATRYLKRRFAQSKIQANAILLWSWVIALSILWPPIFHAMLPEARGAIWIGAGACVLIAACSFGRAGLGQRSLDEGLRHRWDVEDGPTLLPPVIAWREDDE